MAPKGPKPPQPPNSPRQPRQVQKPCLQFKALAVRVWDSAFAGVLGKEEFHTTPSLVALGASGRLKLVSSITCGPLWVSHPTAAGNSDFGQVATLNQNASNFSPEV